MNGDDTTAALLGRFISECAWEQIPKKVVSRAKDYVLDIIGCMIGASKERSAMKAKGAMLQGGGLPHCTVIGHSVKTSVTQAAFLNAAMGHIFDFDDDHLESALHPSTVVFPVVFALGEKLGASGKEILQAYVLGSELSIRLGLALQGKAALRGFHSTSICGVFGAATAAAVLLGLDSEKTTAAMGLAGSFASGNTKWRLGDSWHKPLQAGHAAMCGLMAALMSAEGFNGPATIFDGSDGFIETHAYRDEYDHKPITQNLSEVWQMMGTTIKPHACCSYGASAIDCALGLRQQGIRPEDVQRMTVRTGSIPIKILTEPEKTKRRPSTSVEAQFSLPYMIATAFSNKGAGVAQFREAAIRQPETLALIDKIDWEASPEADRYFPRAYYSEIDASMQDGQIRKTSVKFPRGHPRNPLSRDELVQKFVSLSSPYLNKKKQKSIIELISAFERLKNINTLVEFIA